MEELLVGTFSRRNWEAHFTYTILKTLFLSSPSGIPELKWSNCQINLLSLEYLEQANSVGNAGNECL